MISSFHIKDLFQEVDSFRSGKESPRIGVSANRREGQACIAETYIQAILQAGGAPVIIPAMMDWQALTSIVNSIDGLLMTGGGDINPLFLGEEPIPALQDGDTLRDAFDLALIRLASNRQIPMMGICRGHQILNVAFGGNILQDIYTQSDHPVLKHSQKFPREQVSHSVKLNTGETIYVNSFHHQAIKNIAPEFIETAIAPDGINEGIRHPEKNIFSVQWHPEALATHEDKNAQALFEAFVRNASTFQQAKRLHHRIITLDSHTDTPMIFPNEFNIGNKEGGKVNLPFMEEGLIDATFMVAYIPQGARDEESLKQATNYAMERLAQVKRQEVLNPTRMGIAYTPQDIKRLKEEEKKAICLGVENGYAIGKDLKNIARFKKEGVCYITLCHNGDNDICDSARGKGEWNGLSPFGKEVVLEMNRLGIMVDISHASEKTFYDVLEQSQYPIIASHSSARALCDHPRNLTDEQLKALAGKGGVVQLCLYKGFINPEAGKASLSDAIRHIEHIVDLIGIEHIGIGSDFDGDGELIGCRSSNELINITCKLIEHGYTEADIHKIWGENFLRVMQQVQEVSQG